MNRQNLLTENKIREFSTQNESYWEFKIKWVPTRDKREIDFWYDTLDVQRRENVSSKRIGTVPTYYLHKLWYWLRETMKYWNRLD